VREWVGRLEGQGLRIAIVASRFNEVVTRQLVGGAADALARVGVASDDVELAWVPGAFEIPLVARRLAETRRFDAIVCLGAVIRGDTPHFDHVASQTAAGISAVATDTGVPTMFGVLTTDTMDQAVARAGGKAGNKGADAALAGVELASLLHALATENQPARSSAVRTLP
jgi:6,7-dimethyl-8-ribityllumazine synthase